MESVTIGDGSTPGYCISLDAIDLSLMHQSWDRTVPLWSCASSGPGVDYCEFEVLVDEGRDSDDERRDNASTHQCYVCGESVCASLWQDHVRCDAHRACQTIAHTSLVRAQKMALGVPLPPAPPRSARRSPSPPRSEALAHSQQHANSVLYGKLMIALASLYEHRDNLETVCEDVFGAIAGHETVFKNIQSRLKEGMDLKKTDHSKEEKDNYNVQKKQKNKNNDQEEEKGEDSASTTSTESEESAEAANQQVTSTHNTTTIIARSGAKLNVPFDNYHGFSSSGDKTVCRVCRVVIENSQEHQLDASHTAKVQVAVKDKHCMRQLSNILSHCILCNELLGSSDEGHVLSEAHLAALQRALVLDDMILAGEDSYTRQILADHHIEPVSFNDQIYYCQVCQIYVLKSALIEHVDIDAHKNGLSSFRFGKRSKAVVLPTAAGYCEYCKVGIKARKRGPKKHNRKPEHKFNVWLAEKDSRLHYHFGNTGYPHQVFCKVCFVYVDKNDIIEHVDSFNHQKNYKKILIDNHMEKIAEYKVDCLLCKLKLYMIDVLDHIQSKCHRKKIQECIVYEIGPEEFKLMQQEHQASQNDKLKHILQSNQIYNYYKDEKFYECMACHIWFKKPLLLEHVLSKKHKKACQAGTSQIPKEIKPKDESVGHENIESNINADLKVNSPDFVEIKTKEEEANVDSKEKDESNQSEILMALKTNLIESHSNMYHWCNACKRLVIKSLNMYHIASENHKRNLIKHLKDKEKVTDISKKKDIIFERKINVVSLEDIAENSNTKTGATNNDIDDDYFEHLRKLETNRIEKRQNKYYCDACDANFEVGYETTHMSLESHVNKVAKVNKLYQNELLKKGSQYFCSVCSEWVTCGLEDGHVESERHKANFAKEENIISHGVVKIGINYFCEVCLVSVQRSSGEDHINSDEHKLNQNKVTNTDNVLRTANTKNVKETAANPVKTFDQPKLRLQKPTKKLHYLFDWTYNTELEVICLVCKINLSHNNVTSHRSSKTHQDVYKDLLNTNTMFRIRHRCFCECCREIIKVNQEYMHFTSERHLCNLTRNTRRLDPSALKELSTRMFMEDIAAEKRIKVYERYARTNFTAEESDDYEENRLETDNTFWSINSAAFDESEEEKYSEEDDSVSDSDVGFESAETSVPALEKTIDELEEKVTVDYIMLETHSQEIKLDLPAALRSNSHVLEESNNLKELLCKICSCTIPNRNDLILEHVEGVKHIKMYNSILKNNNLKELFDSSSDTVQKYICKSCGTNVMKSDLFDHINSENHKLYLTAQPSTSGLLPQVNVIKIETSIQTNNTSNLANSIHQQSDDETSMQTNNTSNLANSIHRQSDDETSMQTNNTSNLANSIHQQSDDETLMQTNNTSNLANSIQQQSVDEASMRTNDISNLANSIQQQSDDTQSLSNKTRRKRRRRLNKTLGADTKLNIKGCRTQATPWYYTPGADETELNIKGCQTQATLVEPLNSYESKPPMKQSDQLAVDTKKKSIDEHEIIESGETQKFVKAGAICTNISQPQDKQSIVTQAPNEANVKETKVPTKHYEKTAIASTSSSATSVGTIGNQHPGVVKNYIDNGLCLVCQVNIPHTMPSIIQHLKSKEHNEILKSLKANMNTYSLPTKVDLQQKQSIDQNISETSAHKMGNTNANKVKNKTDSTHTNAHASNTDTYIREGLCTLCDMKILVNNVEEHVNGKNHRTNLKSLVTNTNMPANVKKSHEVIQNLHTTESSLSNTSKTQANIARKITVPYIVGPDSQLSENNVDTYVKSGHCYLCSMNIPNKVSNINDHVNGKNHTANLKSLADNTSLINHIFVYENPHVVSNPIQYNYSAEIQTKINTPVIVGAEAKLPENNIDAFVKRGHCYLCTMEMPNNISNIKDHVNGRNHQGIIQIMLARNKPSVNTQKPYEVTQNLPAVSGPSQNVTSKIETSKEKAIITPVVTGAEAKLADATIDFYVENGYCCLCDMKIPHNISNIKDHVNGRNHKQNLQSLKTKNDNNNPTANVAKASNQSEVYYDCHICNIKVLNSPNNIKQHVESKRHKLNVEIFISGNTVNSNEQTVATDNTSSTNNKSVSFPSTVQEIGDIQTEGSKEIIENESVIDKTSDSIAATNMHSIKSTSQVEEIHNVIAIADNDNNGNSDANKIENNDTNSEDGTRIIVDSNANIGISNSNATDNVENGSRIIVDSNANIGISNSNATDNVENGSRIIVDSNANIGISNSNATNNVENGSRIIVDSNVNNGISHSNATDNVENGNSDTNNPVDDKTNILDNRKDDDQDSNDSYEGFYICRLCNMEIPDNETDINSHLASFRHKINLKEKHFKEGMLPNINTFCNVCKTDVPNNPLAAKKHADSEMHKSKFEMLISDNKIKMRDNRICYCEVCDLYFSKFSVSFHVNRSEHVKHFS